MAAARATRDPTFAERYHRERAEGPAGTAARNAVDPDRADTLPAPEPPAVPGKP